MINRIKMIMGSGSIIGYFLQALPIACLVGIIYLVIRLIRLKKKGCHIKWLSEILRLIFVCYLTGLISLIVLPANFWLYVYDGLFLGWWDELRQIFHLGDLNLIPSVVKCLNGELSIGSWVKTMLIGNIAMFIPLGFFLPLVTRINNWKNVLLTAVAVPVCFEILQLIFGRSLDVDDLICNFIGIVIGAAFAFAVRRNKSNG